MKEKIKNLKTNNLTSHIPPHTSQRGITLIALVITIIVMLILTAVTVTMAVNGGLFNYAGKAVGDMRTKIAEEQELGNLSSDLDYEALIAKYAGGGSGNEPSVIIENQPVTLTPENVAAYIGKVVTNYKTPNSTETVTVTGIDDENEEYEEEYTVSTTYRLFYVDFDNKYGDGEGTIYLKADASSNNYTLYRDGSAATSKIQNLNPALYNTTGVNAPDSDNYNMKYVTWLLDTAKWSGLVTSGEETEIADKINYIVGAPSLEMFIDSYNIHYGLTNSTVDLNPRNANSPRTKLDYAYPNEDLDNITLGYGYTVSPGEPSVADYDVWSPNCTGPYTVCLDSTIGTLYQPGSAAGEGCYIASPSASGASDCLGEMVWSVGGNSLGYCHGSWNARSCFLSGCFFTIRCTINICRIEKL